MKVEKKIGKYPQSPTTNTYTNTANTNSSTMISTNSLTTASENKAILHNINTDWASYEIGSDDDPINAQFMKEIHNSHSLADKKQHIQDIYKGQKHISTAPIPMVTQQDFSPIVNYKRAYQTSQIAPQNIPSNPQWRGGLDSDIEARKRKQLKTNNTKDNDLYVDPAQMRIYTSKPDLCISRWENSKEDSQPDISITCTDTNAIGNVGEELVDHLNQEESQVDNTTKLRSIELDNIDNLKNTTKVETNEIDFDSLFVDFT